LIQTRIATIEDAPELLEQLLEMHSEVPFGEPNVLKIRKHITYLLDSGMGIVYLSYAPSTGIVTGSCGLCWGQPWWWTDQWVISEQWVYVRQEWRSTNSAVSLLRTMQDCAKQLNIPLQTSISSPFDVDRKDKLFSRYGLALGKTILMNAESLNSEKKSEIS